MLPIVKRKTLEIPHGLAAIAAAVCMVLAFATDFGSREQALRAQAAEANPVEIIVVTPDDRSVDQQAASDAARQARLKPAEGASLRRLRLLPLFPLTGQGG